MGTPDVTKPDAKKLNLTEAAVARLTVRNPKGRRLTVSKADVARADIAEPNVGNTRVS